MSVSCKHSGVAAPSLEETVVPKSRHGASKGLATRWFRVTPQCRRESFYGALVHEGAFELSAVDRVSEAFKRDRSSTLSRRRDYIQWHHSKRHKKSETFFFATKKAEIYAECQTAHVCPAGACTSLSEKLRIMHIRPIVTVWFD